MNVETFTLSTFQQYTGIVGAAIEKSTKTIMDECRALTKESYEYFDLKDSEVKDFASDQFENGKTQKCTVLDLGVSFDGSWPTRGHQSKNGFGCVIDLYTGFILDFDITSKYCAVCTTAANELGADSPDFFIWYEGHANNCSINHEGSSGAMESTLAEIIWKRSEDLGFRYVNILSDGDSKAYNHLRSLKVYGPSVEITKEECVNHVSKRVYTGLMNIVKEEKSRKVTLGGKKYGQLKETTIKKLAGFYKKAIYRNKNDVQGMKNDIWASIYHSASTDDNPQHTYCPKGCESWCFYQKALALQKNPGDHKTNIKTPINALCFEKILPLYDKLTNESLLLRCSRCSTQNSNESLHSSIWNKCPKENFTGKERINIAASIAICEFNLGVVKTISEIMKNLAIDSDEIVSKLQIIDKDKMSKGLKKKVNTASKARKIIRTAKKNQEESSLDQEVWYGAGMF